MILLSLGFIQFWLYSCMFIFSFNFVVGWVKRFSYNDFCVP